MPLSSFRITYLLCVEYQLLLGSTGKPWEKMQYSVKNAGKQICHSDTISLHLPVKNTLCKLLESTSIGLFLRLRLILLNTHLETSLQTHHVFLQHPFAWSLNCWSEWNNTLKLSKSCIRAHMFIHSHPQPLSFAFTHQPAHSYTRHYESCWDWSVRWTWFE